VLLDLFCAVLHLRRRVYIPATNAPGHTGAMTVAGSLDGMRSLGGRWENKLAAASLFDVLLYNPSAKVKSIQCPTLVVPGLTDQVFVWKREDNPATRARPGRVTVAEVEGGECVLCWICWIRMLTG
jgi:pimeloyl-ACP methyl ester carboxylesterase